jgi:hypothetical protein
MRALKLYGEMDKLLVYNPSAAVFAIVFALSTFILESSFVCRCARSNAFPKASMFPNNISLLILVAADTFSATLLTAE